MNVFQLNHVSSEAELFKRKLADMLALESQSGWIDLMDYAYQKVPFLKKPGKPTTTEIENSLVGELGYSSWKAFIEDALGWSHYKWKTWSKAHSRVLQHAYLRDIKVSRSAINNAYKELKQEFPKDKEAWEAYCNNALLKDTSSSIEDISQFDLQSEQIIRLEDEKNILELKVHELKNDNSRITKERDEYQNKLLLSENENSRLETQHNKDSRNLFFISLSIILILFGFNIYLILNL